MLCEHCHNDFNSLVVKDLRDRAEMWCWDCHTREKYGDVQPNQAPNVITDEIPGGVEIRHGICNDDGSPRKFYSKSSIKKAAWEAGYFQGDDTPNVNPRIQEQRARDREARERN